MESPKESLRLRETLIPLFLTLLSAGIFSLAQANEWLPYGSPLLGTIALVPFFAALDRCRTFRSARIMGGLFLSLYALGTSYWMLAFADYALWTLSGVVIGYFGYGIVLGQYLKFVISRRNNWRPVFLALSWMLWEYLKSTGFLGNPWGLSLYPFNDFLLFMQIIDTGGIWIPSFIAALINALTAEYLFLHSPGMGLPKSIDKRDAAPPLFSPRSILIRNGIFLTVILGISALYGAYRLNAPLVNKGSSRILMVQKNNNPWRQGSFTENLESNINLTRDSLIERNEEKITVDLAVWSETALLYPYEENRDYYASRPEALSFSDFLAEWPQTQLLTGAPIIVSTNPTEAMNGVILLDSRGEVLRKYGKQHPVPFAESIPFWEFKITRKFFSSVMRLSSVWVLGAENVLFPLQGRDTQGNPAVFQYTTPICFEDAFPGLCRSMVKEGADLLINLTNDAWSQKVSAETQHMMVARMRTIETRRTLIRSTNGGITVVVDPWGRVTHELPPFVKDTLYAEVPILTTGDGFTSYTLLGDWMPALAALVMLAAMIRRRQELKRP